MLGHRVLIVEKDFLTNLDIYECLMASGYRVESVYCASAALEALDRHRCLSALVTDIELGFGPDGFAVGRKARAVYPDLPVIYLSATQSARHKLEGVIDSEFVGMPLHSGQIVRALNRLLLPSMNDNDHHAIPLLAA